MAFWPIVKTNVIVTTHVGFIRFSDRYELTNCMHTNQLSSSLHSFLCHFT